MALLRRALVGASIGWAALLPIAPFAASQPAPASWWYALAFAVYGLGSVVCHQLPERSFHLWSAQLPVCARCTGIYAGAAAAAVVATVRSREAGATSRVRLMLVVAALPTVATLAYEWAAGHAPSNVIRAVSGAPLGAAVAFVVLNAARRVN